MTEIEQKALALVNEIEREEGENELTLRIMRGLIMDKALCRAIEQHESFKLEVSDAIDSSVLTPETEAHLSRFIIPKTDPLVEALNEALLSEQDMGAQELADNFRAALAARGLTITETKE